MKQIFFSIKLLKSKSKNLSVPYQFNNMDPQIGRFLSPLSKIVVQLVYFINLIDLE
jgi:hypothetical protein